MKRRWTLAGRVLVTVLLLGVAVALAVRFGHLEATPDPATKHFPDEAALAADYSSLVGSRVELYGSVTATNPVVVKGTYGGHELAVTVVDVTTDPAVGEYLHVYGVAEPGGTVRAIDTVVYPATGITFTYAVSALAGAWTVCRFLNRWTFAREEMAFTPRSEPRVKLTVLLTAVGGGDRA